MAAADGAELASLTLACDAGMKQHLQQRKEKLHSGAAHHCMCAAGTPSQQHVLNKPYLRIMLPYMVRVLLLWNAQSGACIAKAAGMLSSHHQQLHELSQAAAALHQLTLIVFRE
jgi:hypothetical protein